MECNKDEAIRAKEIAEKKMENQDFVGAQKFLIRCRRLYPDLENISQMLAICEIHCSAGQKVLGSEMDWYSILQVEQTADEISIKKQYRKLALILHPDKNKFAGAEAAFKLIGEAQRVLSDQSKRSVYDMKLRTFAATASSEQPPKQPSQDFSFWKQPPGVQKTSVYSTNPQFTSFKSHPQQPPQTGPGFSMGKPFCPFCNRSSQFYYDVLRRVLCCQNCMQPFIAHGWDAHGEFPRTNSNSNQSTFAQPKVFPVQTDPKVAFQNAFNQFRNMGFQGNCSKGPRAAKSFLNTQSRPGTGVGSSKTKGKEDRTVTKGLSKKAEKLPKVVAEKFKEDKLSNKGKKWGKTFPNAQSNFNVDIGTKTKGKNGVAGMGVGKKAEKVSKLWTEKSKEGKPAEETNKKRGRATPNTQSTSNVDIGSKSKGKDGNVGIGMWKKTEKGTNTRKVGKTSKKLGK